MDPTYAARRRWLEENPFLAPLAKFEEAISQAAEGVPCPRPELLPIGACAESFAMGVPFLRSPTHGPPLAAAGASALGELAGRATGVALPAKIAEGLAEIGAATRSPEARAAAIAWLVAGGGEEGAPVQAGLLKFLGWKAMGRVLAPLRPALDALRDEKGWHHPICPTCGQPPAMAYLVAKDGGRERMFACGLCATRWPWRRVGCPYCGNEAAERLSLLELEGPAPLRLDVCESCHGYLKTYTGQGDEALFLADWPTLVLDAMAVERGYVRRGASLYEL